MLGSLVERSMEQLPLALVPGVGREDVVGEVVCRFVGAVSCSVDARFRPGWGGGGDKGKWLVGERGREGERGEKKIWIGVSRIEEGRRRWRLGGKEFRRWVGVER